MLVNDFKINSFCLLLKRTIFGGAYKTTLFHFLRFLKLQNLSTYKTYYFWGSLHNQIKEFSFFKNESAINYNNHYISVNDEAVFDYGFKQLRKENKAFLYILTINSHLPFHTQSGKSELESQYNRIKEQFAYLAVLLKQYPVDKLVIVGDHPPPFLTEFERSHYATKYVPALIIQKR